MDRLISIGLTKKEINEVGSLILGGEIEVSNFSLFTDNLLATSLRNSIRSKSKSTKDICVAVRYSSSSKTNIALYTITVKRYAPFYAQILSHFKIHFPRKNFCEYILRDSENKILMCNEYEILPPQPWQFLMSENITPESASNWTEDDHLSKLSILVKQVHSQSDLFENFNMIDSIISSNKANTLILELESFDRTIIEQFIEYDNNKNDLNIFDIIRRNKIMKLMCLSSKYSNVESLVNLFMIFLFDAIGFYDERLFAFPEFPHQLRFGRNEKMDIKEAKPDFTIMDVFSYLRMAVVEDKSCGNDVKEGQIEAQLIGEAIAIYQANESLDRSMDQNDNEIEPQKLEQDEVLGVITKGLNLTFYIIPITQYILESMATLEPAKVNTVVKRYGPFNFLNRSQRKTIIEVLDILRQIITFQGEKSVRRNSGCKK